MTICRICVLPETFPGVSLDSDGVCAFCRKHERSAEWLAGEKRKYLSKFRSLVGRLSGGSGVAARRGYDVIMAYSGGKDSTYTLKLLKEEFRLKVLAVTFNHGFISPRAVENIYAVTDALSVDHVMLTPAAKTLRTAFSGSMASELYPLKALERASAICTTCMNMAKSLLLKHAVRMAVPLIAYGWSPGQAPVQSSVMRLNLSLVRQTQKAVGEALGRIIGEEAAAFVLDERDLRLFNDEAERQPELYFHNVHPLAFLQYDEAQIVEEIRSLGWAAPRDTDANSTNCLLNSFANQVHIEKYGFHPYACEIAGLVREGYMNRDEGMAKLSQPSDQTVISEVKERLGIQDAESRI